MKVFRVIDFETTGFPPNAGVIEVAATDVMWDGPKMEIGETQSELCNPGIPIDPGAKAVHHLQESDLEGKPHPDHVICDLEFNADFIVAHNLAFEEKFFTPSKPTICTMKAAKQLIESPKYGNQYLRYFLDLPMDRSRAEPAHRAGPDTYVTAVLLVHLLKLSAQKHGAKFVDYLVTITNQPQLLTAIRFGKYAGKTFEEIAYSDRKYLIWIVNNDRAEADVKNTAQHWLDKTR